MNRYSPDPAFSTDVREGLSASPRRLSSKWFYDKRGDGLFQAIMAMPEYYLTGCEEEIYRSAGPQLLEAIGPNAFDLVELGAGDGTKTQYLVEQFLAAGAEFTYRPVDISANALAVLGELIGRRWPDLPFAPERGDYFVALERLLAKRSGTKPNLVLFPGANIGNFTPAAAADFLKRLRGYLRPGDLLLTGFDLKKDPAVVLAAYNDPAGHTAAFNLNLLTRINRELGGNFDPENWLHWETYDPVSGAARSYIVARAACTVTLADHETSYHFEPAEAIEVEISQKYSRREIRDLAAATGYTFLRSLEDHRGYFTDSLWRV